MFINPDFNFELEIKNSSRLKLLKNKLNNDKLKIGDKVKVPWFLLKTSSFRRNKLKIKCDDCGKEFTNRICNLDENIKNHYCSSCFQKGKKHYNYGNSIHVNTRNGLKKWLENNENPAKREEVRNKISNNRKGKPSNMLGKKQSEETKKKIRNSNKIAIKKAWEDGKLNYKSKYSNSKTKNYKGINYQGNYELDFLKECEKNNILDLIERGPALNYIDENGKSRLYLVDYKIKNTDILIEIKSSYTIKLNKNNNLCKFKAGKINGDFLLIIDKNYSELYKKIKNYGV
jgi:hypothetical protein